MKTPHMKNDFSKNLGLGHTTRQRANSSTPARNAGLSNACKPHAASLSAEQPRPAMNEVKLAVAQGSEFARALARVRFLAAPDTLNALLDEFQCDGMPMGSDRWAEHVLTRYRELREKERTLRKMLNAIEEMETARKYCGSKFHREQRRKITEEFQERKRREEVAAETQNGT